MARCPRADFEPKEREKSETASHTLKREKRNPAESPHQIHRVSASQEAGLQRQPWSDKVPLFTSRQDQAVPAPEEKKKQHRAWPPASTPKSKQRTAPGRMQMHTR